MAALANFMRLSLLKAAHAVLGGATYRKSGSAILDQYPSPSGLGSRLATGPPGLDKLLGRRFHSSEISRRTISLARHYALANVPSVIQRAVIWNGHRPVAGDVVFPKLSKLLNQEDALSAPSVILLSIDFLKTLCSRFLSKTAAKSFVLSRWSNFLYFPPS
jgi:hypothetical protein